MKKWTKFPELELRSCWDKSELKLSRSWVETIGLSSVSHGSFSLQILYVCVSYHSHGWTNKHADKVTWSKKMFHRCLLPDLAWWIDEAAWWWRQQRWRNHNAIDTIRTLRLLCRVFSKHMRFFSLQYQFISISLRVYNYIAVHRSLLHRISFCFSEIMCKSLHPWDNYIPNTNSTSAGIRVNYTCGPEYKLVTPEGEQLDWKTSYCQYNGEWQPAILPCKGNLVFLHIT